MTFEHITKLKSILKDNNISDDPKVLENYQSDASLGFIEPKVPDCVVWPENIKEIQQLVELANNNLMALVPISSESPRFHGTGIARKENTIIVDFTKMKKILNIDVKNRGVMLETGVNFEEYI